MSAPNSRERGAWAEQNSGGTLPSNRGHIGLSAEHRKPSRRVCRVLADTYSVIRRTLTGIHRTMFNTCRDVCQYTELWKAVARGRAHASLGPPRRVSMRSSAAGGHSEHRQYHQGEEWWLLKGARNGARRAHVFRG